MPPVVSGSSDSARQEMNEHFSVSVCALPESSRRVTCIHRKALAFYEVFLFAARFTHGEALQLPFNS